MKINIGWSLICLGLLSVQLFGAETAASSTNLPVPPTVPVTVDSPQSPDAEQSIGGLKVEGGLFLTNCWNNPTWPAPDNIYIGPSIEGINNIKTGSGQLSFNVTFWPQFLAEGMSNLPSLHLDDLLIIRLASAGSGTTGSKVDFLLKSISPTKLDVKTYDYNVILTVDPSQTFEGKNLQLEVTTIYREQMNKYVQTNLLWMGQALKNLAASNLSLGLPEAALANLPKLQEGSQNILASLANEVRNLTNSSNADSLYNILTNLPNGNLYRANLKLTALTNRSAWGSNAASNSTNFNRFLVMETNLYMLRDLADWRNTNQAVKTNDADLDTDIFTVLADRFYYFNYLEKAVKSASGEILNPTESLAGADASFIWTGQIIGFGNFIESVQPMDYKDVQSTLGQGIANYFYVVSVIFLNTNANDVLLYGDKISVPCTYLECTYNSIPDHDKLLNHAPNDGAWGFHITTNAVVSTVLTNWVVCNVITNQLYNNVSGGFAWERRSWCLAKHYGGIATVVSNGCIRIPYWKSLLDAGYDKREFDTTKARVLRTMDVVANSLTAVIPFVNSATYANSAGIFSGIAQPGVRKLWGDASSIQRHTFDTESMPQYLPLKIGESVTKLIYLPRFGWDQGDYVEFIHKIGDDKSQYQVEFAILQTTDKFAQNSGNNTMASTSPPAPTAPTSQP